MHDHQFNLNTDKNIVIITSKQSHFHIIGIILGFIVTNIFLSFYLSLGGKMGVQIFLYLLLFFTGTYISCLMIKVEYKSLLKNYTTVKPQLQWAVLIITFGLIIFLSTPNTFPGGKKSDLHILILLLVGLIISSLVFKRIYSVITIKILEVLHKIQARRILDQPHFVEKVSTKFFEVQRYGGIFSIILITITMDDKNRSKVEQSMVLPLIFGLLKANIRRTDTLGFLGRGRIAAIFSNNNNTEAAKIHATRLIENLEDDKILNERITKLNLKYKSAICTYNDNIPDGETIIITAQNELKTQLKEVD